MKKLYLKFKLTLAIAIAMTSICTTQTASAGGGNIVLDPSFTPLLLSPMMIYYATGVSLSYTQIGNSFDYTIHINESGTYAIYGQGYTTTYVQFVVTSGLNVTITLHDVILDRTQRDGFPFGLSNNSTCKLILDGTNRLIGGLAGFLVYESAQLDIQEISADGGMLSAIGGDGGAGIGGVGGVGGTSCGTITIKSGTIYAQGGAGAAGIGGGIGGNGGTVTITGGEVYPRGGAGAAGIGGGGYWTRNGNGGTVTINGGIVGATGGTGGAGIGGGEGGNGGTVTIYGGTVDATGGLRAAGIGGGDGGDGATVNIHGGKVTATGRTGGAGIGSGVGAYYTNEYGLPAYRGNGGTVTINGGTVNAIGGGMAAAGIGVGDNDGVANMGALTINGGSVYRSGKADLETPAKNGAGAPVYLSALTVGDPHVADGTGITAGKIGSKSCSQVSNPSNGVYGIYDVVTDNNGKVYFWLPEASGNRNISLTAGGNAYSNSVTAAANNSNAATLYLSSAPGITIPALVGAVGEAYSYTVVATGWPAPTLSISGALPDGLSFDPATGVISGTPEEFGGFNFSITATNDVGSVTASSGIVIDLGAQSAPAGLTAVGETVPGAADGMITGVAPDMEYRLAGDPTYTVCPADTIRDLAPGAYDVRYAALANYYASPDTQLIILGAQAAPTGLTAIDETATGAIDGMIIGVTTDMEYRLTGDPTYTVCPADTIRDLAPGTYEVRYAEVAASFAASPDTLLTIVAYIAVPPVITTPSGSLAGGEVGTAYSVTLAATGTPDPTSWTIAHGALPDGLRLNPATGVISGTPAMAGTASFIVKVSNGIGTDATQQFSISIAPDPAGMPAPTIGSPTLPSVTVGLPYSVDVIAVLDINGTPTPTVTVTGLPTGLTYSEASGVISGSTSATGSYTVVVSASNIGGTTTVISTLVVGATANTVSPNQIIIPSIPHVTTDPAVGAHYVTFGGEFTVTLTPDEGYRLATAKVKTGNDTFDATIKYTLNDDGTLTVVIPKVTRDIRLDLTGVSPVANEEIDGAKVWASGGRLYIHALSGGGKALIYNVSGTLFRTVIAPAGETTVDLPSGLYVVRIGKMVVKVVI